MSYVKYFPRVPPTPEFFNVELEKFLEIFPPPPSYLYFVSRVCCIRKIKAVFRSSYDCVIREDSRKLLLVSK